MIDPKIAPKVIITLLIVVSAGLFLFFLARGLQVTNTPSGMIVYRRDINESTNLYEFLVADGDGNQLTTLGYYRGSPAWSRDGKFLIVGCGNDSSKLCIIDTTSISISKEFPDRNSLSKVTQSIDLPLSCQAVLSDNGVQSVSWSPDGQKLIVLCSDGFDSKEHEVCIVPLDEIADSYCWDHSWQYRVARVDWSPKEDRILVSSNDAYGSKIYITDVYGKDRDYLADGWGATWSPDGKQIAFMQWQNEFFRIEGGKIIIDETVNQFSGLAVINRDGSDLKWLYRNLDDSKNPTDIISFNCGGMENVCRASWSPDGRYIVFAGRNGGMYTFHLFRFDLKTGKVIFISPRDEYSRFVSEPVWGR